jgi:hypothetical protein
MTDPPLRINNPHAQNRSDAFLRMMGFKDELAQREKARTYANEDERQRAQALAEEHQRQWVMAELAEQAKREKENNERNERRRLRMLEEDNERTRKAAEEWKKNTAAPSEKAEKYRAKIYKEADVNSEQERLRFFPQLKPAAKEPRGPNYMPGHAWVEYGHAPAQSNNKRAYLARPQPAAVELPADNSPAQHPVDYELQKWIQQHQQNNSETLPQLLDPYPDDTKHFHPEAHIPINPNAARAESEAQKRNSAQAQRVTQDARKVDLTAKRAAEEAAARETIAKMNEAFRGQKAAVEAQKKQQKEEEERARATQECERTNKLLALAQRDRAEARELEDLKRQINEVYEREMSRGRRTSMGLGVGRVERAVREEIEGMSRMWEVGKEMERKELEAMTERMKKQDEEMRKEAEKKEAEKKEVETKEAEIKEDQAKKEPDNKSEVDSNEDETNCKADDYEMADWELIIEFEEWEILEGVELED